MPDHCRGLTGDALALADAASALPLVTVQWLNAAAASPDDIFGAQYASAGVKKSIWRGVARTSITLRDGRPPHGAGRNHHTDRQQRAGTAESDVQAAGKLLRMVLHFHNSTSLTALFSASRGRARARFSRADVAVYFACDLQCEFEVGVSLKNPLQAVTNMWLGI